MDFAEKPNIAIGSAVKYDGKYQKPLICPRCGFGTDGPITGFGQTSYAGNGLFISISIRCTHCNQHFVAAYCREGKDEIQYVACIPQPSGHELHEGFAKISPRFVDMHRQAEAAELHGLFDISAMGYRAALEILVKDYAINELKVPSEEVKKIKKLSVAIGRYLKQESLVKTADVVRILGNDHTHYDSEFPEHGFSVLKHYYKIFLELIATQYDINHPPVAR